jgi:2,4-dienoyl-CoA reductase-like NADH-dependent reductase (Old Yellow Enzyme family)/thioredoxin reductase
MHPRYPRVFSPIRLGPVELPNRYFFAPHGSALSAGTKPADDLVAYSAERVRGGGCGLVMVALAMHERGRTRQPSPHLAENIPAFRVLTDAIHEAGGKIFGEPFYHWIGAGSWRPLSTPAPAFAPSVRQFGLNGRTHSTHAMSLDEIERMIAATQETAANMAAAGFDGIMLHVSHAALIQQFLSPLFNERTDRYGGSFEGRLRFLAESLAACRAGGGADFAVGIRLNCDEQIDGGYHADTAREVVTALCARRLVDYIDLDVGLEPQQFHHGMPTGFEPAQYYRPFVEAVRSASSVPVLSVLGNITRMADAEAALEAGVCDVIGSARQLIAEPAFVRHAWDGEEHLDRTCIACNWCTAAGGDGAQGCTINPASYREKLWGEASFTPAPTPTRVIVVGGGPGGMEAARVAALRGHEVVLLEARERLGGALALWAELPGRAHYRPAIEWWSRELDRLGVEVRLGVQVQADAVLAEAPGAVIVATGARYSPGGRSIHRDVDIAGSDLPHVLRPEDILVGNARPAGRVLVLDAEGYHTGCGIAEMLAAVGARVAFVYPGHAPISQRNTDNWEERYLVGRMKTAGVRLVPTSCVREIRPGEVVLYDMHTGEARTEAADAVVLAAGREPLDGIARALEGRVPQLFTIGDALAARMFAAATFEGQMFARMIGEPGAPATVGEAWFAPDPPGTMPMPADLAPGR